MSRTGNRLSGFTVIELLAVLAIITILLGVFFGAYSRMSAERRFNSVATAVRNTLVLARSMAQSRRSPVTVRIDPFDNAVRTFRESTITLFRLEDAGEEVEGTGGFKGTVHNANPVTGVIGGALEFGTTEGLECSNSYVEVEPNYLLSPPGGIVLEAWIYPGNFRGKKFRSLIEEETYEEEREEEQEKDEPVTFKERYEKEFRFIIIERSGSYYLRLTESYALEFGIEPETSVLPFRTRNSVVKPNMWNHILVSYDTEELRISVNGVSVSVFWVNDDVELIPLYKMNDAEIERALPPRIPESEEPLYISAPDDSFYGIIDEVRIGAITLMEEYSLPATAHLVGTERSIHFNRRGELDPFYHSSDVEIVVTDKMGYEPPPPEEAGFSEGGALDAPPTPEAAEEVRYDEKKTSADESYEPRIAVLRVTTAGETSLSLMRWYEFFEEEAEYGEE